MGIGKNSKLPWKCPEELFKEKTQNTVLIMGHTTISTLPFLKNRKIARLSRSSTENLYSNPVKTFTCIDQIRTCYPDDKIIIAGGA